MVVVSMKTSIEAYNPSYHNEDIERLSHHLRAMDLLELREKGKWDGVDTLAEAIQYPDYKNYCAYGDDGTMLGVLGISEKPMYEDMYCIWFMGSTAMETSLPIKREFVRRSKQMLETWKAEYGRLFNYVHRENHLIRTWLLSVGATLYDTDCQEYQLFIID